MANRQARALESRPPHGTSPASTDQSGKDPRWAGSCGRVADQKEGPAELTRPARFRTGDPDSCWRRDPLPAAPPVTDQPRRGLAVPWALTGPGTWRDAGWTLRLNPA